MDRGGGWMARRLVCWCCWFGMLGTSPAATWTRVATLGPSPTRRSCPAVAAIRNQVYLFGGVYDEFRTGGNRFYNDLYRFDRNTGRWSSLLPLGERPAPRAFAGFASDLESELLFLFGGASYGPQFANLLNYADLWAYSPLLNRWTLLRPINQGPRARSSPCTWLSNGRLFVFGGIEAPDRPLNDLWVYDLEANRWTQLIPPDAPGSPAPRHDARCGSRTRFGKMVIYGGETVSAAGFVPLNDTWEYDLQRNRWEEITPNEEANIRPARNFAAAGVIGANLYVQGGDLPGGLACCGAPFPQNPSDEIWRFDLLRRVWARVWCSVPPPRLKRHAAVEVGDEVYFFCGFDFVASDNTGQVWNETVYLLRP